MTTDVCPVCGCNKWIQWTDCTDERCGSFLCGYDPEIGMHCENGGRIAITRASELARLQAVNAELVAAARIGEKFLILELESYPIGHKGSCGPWNPCDGNCAARAYISQDLYKVQQAIANATKEPR